MPKYVPLRKLPINAQGYDRLGRYWGTGETLYELGCNCPVPNMGHGHAHFYFRAPNRAHAVIEARKVLSNYHPNMDVRS